MSTAREAFENWYSQDGEHGGLLLDRFGDSGDYVEDSVQAMWTAWQAARAQGGQGVEPIVAYRYRIIDDPQGWEYSSEPLFGPESGPGPKEEYQALTLDQLLSVLNDTQAQPAVPKVWRECLEEMVRAMHDYEMSVDEDAPYKHRAMMDRAHALLSTTSTPQAKPAVPEGWISMADEYQKFDKELCREVFEKLNAEFDKDPRDGMTVYTEDWRASVNHLIWLGRQSAGSEKAGGE